MRNVLKGWQRFWIVVGLFAGIIWSFYSLRFTRLWHEKGWEEKRRQELWVEKARYFRETAVDLGGLLIKLGQFFSARVDVFPSSVIHELENLQDEVKGVPFEDIRSAISEEFGRPLEEIFAIFEPEAIAAASLGQVHHAVLQSGEELAVKILRPGIERLVKIDLSAVKQVVKLLDRFTDWGNFMDLNLIYQEFYETVYEELDYLQEGNNAERIAQNSQDLEQVLIPKIYWEYTTKRVLAMEYMPGIKISNYDELDKHGVDREQVARLLVKIYCRQVFIDGFFHADPHPGNLFVTEEGKIVLIDFGMTGSITDELRDQLTKLATAAVKRDHQEVVHWLKEMGFLHKDAPEEQLAQAIGIILEGVIGSGLSAPNNEIMDLLADLEVLFYEYPFHIPGNYTFLGRAAGTLYGLCIGLYPTINFLDEIKPYLEQFIGGKRGVFDKVKQEAADYINGFLQLPLQSTRVLRRLEEGQLMVKVDMKPVLEAERQTRRALNSISLVLLFGFVFFTSAYLLVNGWILYARIGFVLSLIIFVSYLRHINRRDSGTRFRHPQHIPRGSKKKH
jgi:predicted unusual protein kinase regulating ubiquinone biosynthesis (AarF/ABC1/UbiB family)